MRALPASAAGSTGARIRAEYLQERGLLAEFGERGGDPGDRRDGLRRRYRSSTPTCPTRAGRDSKRVIDTLCRASGSSSLNTAPGLFATATISDVWSWPLDAVGCLPIITKRVRLCGSSWIMRVHHAQAVMRRRAIAGDGRDGRIFDRHARRFGVARHRLALEMRRVRVQPALALRERLRMRAHARHAIERAGAVNRL